MESDESRTLVRFGGSQTHQNEDKQDKQDKRRIIDELNRVAFTVQQVRTVETPSVMGFLQGIYDRYVGSVGGYGLQRGIEGFQLSPAPAPATVRDASGGTIYTTTDSREQLYTVHFFDRSGSFQVINPIIVAYAVAGAGGGGSGPYNSGHSSRTTGSSGGSGGYGFRNRYEINPKTVTVGVGTGGRAGQNGQAGAVGKTSFGNTQIIRNPTSWNNSNKVHNAVYTDSSSLSGSAGGSSSFETTFAVGGGGGSRTDGSAGTFRDSNASSWGSSSAFNIVSLSSYRSGGSGGSLNIIRDSVPTDNQGVGGSFTSGFAVQPGSSGRPGYVIIAYPSNFNNAKSALQLFNQINTAISPLWTPTTEAIGTLNIRSYVSSIIGLYTSNPFVTNDSFRALSDFSTNASALSYTSIHSNLPNIINFYLYKYIDIFFSFWDILSQSSKASFPTVTASLADKPGIESMTDDNKNELITRYSNWFTLIMLEIVNTIFTDNVVDFFTNTYVPARRYILDSDLSGVTVTNRQNARRFINANGTMATTGTSVITSQTLTQLITIRNYCTEGIRDTVDTLIKKYHERLRTARPSEAAISSSTSLTDLQQLRTMYLELWNTELVNSTNIVTNYEAALLDSEIPDTDPNSVNKSIVEVDRNKVSTVAAATDAFDANGVVTFKYKDISNVTTIFSSLSWPSASSRMTSTVIGYSICSTRFINNQWSEDTTSTARALQYLNTSRVGLNSINRRRMFTLSYISPNTAINPIRFIYDYTLGTGTTLLVEIYGRTYATPVTNCPTDLTGSTLLFTNEFTTLASSATTFTTTPDIIDANTYNYFQFVLTASHATSSRISASFGNIRVVDRRQVDATATSKIVVADTIADFYRTKLNNILHQFRTEAIAALDAFITKFQELNPEALPDYTTNTFYTRTQLAHAAAATDRSTNIPALQVISDILAKKTYYETALTDAILAGNRTKLQQSIVNFQATYTYIVPPYISQTDIQKVSGWTNISGARKERTDLTDTTGSPLPAFIALTSNELVIKRTAIFENATRKLTEALLEAYKTYRSTNAILYEDLTALSRSDADVNVDKASLDQGADKVLEIRDNYVGNTNSYWPALKRYATKTTSRVDLLNAFTAFVSYYVEFRPVMTDAKPTYLPTQTENGPTYSNTDMNTLFSYVDPQTFIPTNSFFNQNTEVLNQIRVDYLGYKFTNLVTDIRQIYKERIQVFNDRRAATASIVNLSGIAEPASLQSLPTTTHFVDNLTSAALSTSRQEYYGTMTPTIKKGHIEVLEDLIAAAILENKRVETVIAIRNFVKTYESSNPYINPNKALTSYIRSYYADASTYVIGQILTERTERTERTEKFNALVLGSEANANTFAPSAANVTTLFQIQYIYEYCTRGVTAALVTGFIDGFAEKAGLQMPWSPTNDITLASVGGDAEATIIKNPDTSMSVVDETRDTYLSHWAKLDIAAKDQLTSQIDLWTALKDKAVEYDIPLTAEYSALSSSDKPTNFTTFYSLRSVYDKYDTAGKTLMSEIRTWLSSRIQEYDSLYRKYAGFQANTMVRHVKVPAALFLTNTATTDKTSVNAYTLYTSNIKSLLDTKLAAYIDSPEGGLPKLKAFVRQELLLYIEEFNTQWTTSGSVTLEEYTTYDADKAVAENSNATSVELEEVLGHYFAYSDELREANLQQAVLFTMSDFISDLYMPNLGILVVSESAKKGKVILDAQQNIVGGEKYIEEITKDAINDKNRLREIQVVYYIATYALAEQVASDLNVQQDAFVALYNQYTEFRAVERRNEAGEAEIMTPAAVRDGITTAAVESNKVQIQEKLKTLLDTLNTESESIRNEVAAFVDVVNDVRQTVVEDMFVSLREDITTAMRAYIAAFGPEYDRIARDEIKDPYTTRVEDAALVAEDQTPSKDDLTGLIASYTGYTDDLITSNYQVRALEAIQSFYVNLYGANNTILPTLDEMVQLGVNPIITSAVVEATDIQRLINNVVELDEQENEDRVSLQEIRIRFKDAADALVPLVIARLGEYITTFDNMYTNYSVFYTMNQTLRDGAVFSTTLADLDLTLVSNPSASQRDTLSGFTATYNESLRQQVETIRIKVLEDIESLRTFLITQLGAFVTYYSQQYTSTNSTTLIANTNGYLATDTLDADRATINRGVYSELATLMNRYKILVRQLIVSQKQQTLQDTIALFADDLLEPNRSFIPPITGQIAQKYSEVAVDRNTANALPELPATLDGKMQTMATYMTTLDSLQSSYNVTINDLRTVIQDTLKTVHRQTKELYRNNMSILRKEVPQAVLAADANIDADEGSVGSVVLPTEINTLRERYTEALKLLFPLVKQDMIDYIDEMNSLAETYESFRSSNSWSLESAVDTNQLLTDFQNVAENTIARPNAQVINSTVVLSDTFIATVNKTRTDIVLGTFPALKTFVQDQLRTFIPYFKKQYDEVSKSETKQPYKTFNADRDAVAENARPSTEDLKRLLNAYRENTTDLVTANLQFRVARTVLNFLQLNTENRNAEIDILPILPEEVAEGLVDAITTNDNVGVVDRILSAIRDDFDDRDYLLGVEERYSRLITVMIPIVKQAIDDKVVEYDVLQQGYLTFVERNKSRFNKALGVLDEQMYNNTTEADRGTLDSFTSFSDLFISESRRIRTSTLDRLTGCKTFVSAQLTAYIAKFSESYELSPPSRTLRQNLVYTSKEEDLGIVASKEGLVGVLESYTTYTSALLLASREEKLARLIEDYKSRLYDPNLIVVAIDSHTDAMQSSAAGSAAAIQEAVRDKKIGEDWDKYGREMTALETTLTAYETVTQDWLMLLKTQLNADLTAYRTLYTQYVAFDSEFSRYYDLSAIPTSLSGNYVVIADIDDVGSIESVYTTQLDMLLTRLRDTYYFDPAASSLSMYRQIPALVKFIKSQIKDYIAKYSGDYRYLPSNLKPICSIEGNDRPCIDTAQNLTYVEDESYSSVEDLRLLNDMVNAYITNTPALESAIRINMRKIETRDLITRFNTTWTSVLNSAKELEFEYLPSNVNIDTDRERIDRVTSQDAINQIYTEYMIYITQLCFEVMARFVQLYVDNLYLEPYFIRTAREIYNAFNVTINTEILKATDNLKNSIKFMSTKVSEVEEGIDANITIALEYGEYCKKILENKEDADTLKDTTDSYKSQALDRIRLVMDERTTVAGLVGLSLSSSLLNANTGEAERVVQNATYISDAEPTKINYDGYYKELRNKVHALLQAEIDNFKTAMEQFGSLQRFFSDDLIAAKDALNTEPNDRTKADSEVELDALETRTLIETYRGYQADIVRQSDPETGAMYQRARNIVSAGIDLYVQHVFRASQLQGDVFKSNRTIGSVLQVTTQGDRDKNAVKKSMTFETILVFNDMYVEKERVLLDAMYDYAAEVIDDGFIKMYNTIRDKGLEEFVAEPIKAAQADVEANREKIAKKLLGYEDVRRLLEIYIGLSLNVAMETKRAEARKVLRTLLTFIDQVYALETAFIFSNTVPTIAATERVLLNIDTIRAIPVLQQIADQYTSILDSARTQFNSYSLDALREFATFYEKAKSEDAVVFLEDSVQGAVGTISADLSSTATRSVEEIAEMAEKYTMARQLGERNLLTKAADIRVRRTRNAVAGVIAEFKADLEAARTLEPLQTQLETLDADVNVTEDEEAIAASSTPVQTLNSLQNVYTRHRQTIQAAVRRVLLEAVTQFNQVVLDAQRKKATLPTNVRLAIATLTSDVRKVESGISVLEMRDMYQNYGRLTASVSSVLPASNDLTGSRTEVAQLIRNFQTLMGGVGNQAISFTTAVRTANPTQDQATAQQATRLEELTALRTKYIQMIYEVNTKLEEATETRATQLAIRKREATEAMTSFRTELTKTPLNLLEFPQLVEARDKISRNTEILADSATTLETATSILTTYNGVLDILRYRTSVATAADRDAKKEIALIAMNRFTQVYQANIDIANRFSAGIQNSLMGIPGDVSAVQSASTSITALDELQEKYDSLTQRIQQELGLIQQTRISETVAAIRSFRSTYQLIPSADIDRLPDYLRLDVRMMDRDIETLEQPSVVPAIIQTIATRYGKYKQELERLMPNLGEAAKASQRDKDQLRAIVRELSALFQENTGIYGGLSPSVQSRIQQIGGTLRLVQGNDASADEIRGLVDDYATALRTFKERLRTIPLQTQASVRQQSLETIMETFRTLYSQSDIYKLGKNDFNYIQLLLNNQGNATFTRDLEGAIRAYSRGVTILGTVPRILEKRVPNTTYNSLLESMNTFMREWSIRTIGRAIPNDRLLLTGLKNNVQSYTELYRERKPNMMNYNLVVDGLKDQYDQGLRILRTYPLKN